MKDSIKQVIVVNKNTTPKMRKGKLGSQVGHAVESFLTKRILECCNGMRSPEQFMKYGDFDIRGYLDLSSEMMEWLSGNLRTKIVLGVKSEQELLEIYEKVKEAGVEVHLIKDSGKTEFAEPTITCIGIGPDRSSRIDPFTQHLELI